MSAVMNDQRETVQLGSRYPQNLTDGNARKVKSVLEPILIESGSSDLMGSYKKENMSLDNSFLIQRKSLISAKPPVKHLQTIVLNGNKNQIFSRKYNSFLKALPDVSPMKAYLLRKIFLNIQQNSLFMDQT